MNENSYAMFGYTEEAGLHFWKYVASAKNLAAKVTV